MCTVTTPVAMPISRRPAPRSSRATRFASACGIPAPNASGAPGTAAVAEALPVVTFEGPTALHLNGQAVRLTPMPPRHTDGDVMIELPQLDVLVVGDYFRSVGYPVADRNSGGSFRGIVEALGITLGKAGPATRVIPGHGPISNRAGLIEQRDTLIAAIDAVEKLVRQGMTVEQVLAAKPTAALDDRVPQGAQNAERFVRGLYAELSDRETLGLATARGA